MDASDFLRNPSDSDSGHNGDLGNGTISIDNDLDSPTLDTVSGFSSCSSPIPTEPFQPRFAIWFTDDVYKDADVVKYTIKSIPADKQPHTEYFVQRQYEDFEWLEHCLLTANPVLGIIVPPLPSKPAITSEMAEAKSKKQLGNNTRTLMGDDFYKDCRMLEEYLRLLLAHPLFGNDLYLEKFLTVKEAPARAKVKKGLLSRISESLEGRKGTHKDCEDFFQKERDWANNYGSAIKEASQTFNTMIYSQQRLCGVIGHLATTFTLCVGGNESGLRDCVLLSDALENYKHGFEVESFNSDRTLGSYLELYSKYIEAEKEMLARRTGLLVDYENANKTLDKSKPNKRESAEEAKLAAEKAFEECSDVARQEIKRFHRQRVQTFGAMIEKFADFQVKNARDVCALLAKSLNQIVQQNAKEPLPILKE